MDNVIKLEYPIQAHGEEVTELVFPERCKARHMRGLNFNPTIDDMLDKLANLARIPKSSIDQVDKDDVVRLMDFYGEFFSMPDTSET